MIIVARRKGRVSNFLQTTASTNFSSTYGNSANSPNFYQQQNLNRYPAPMPLKENRNTFNQYGSNQYSANSDNAQQRWDDVIGWP